MYFTNFSRFMSCAAFWKHTNIRSGDRIFPCCRFKYPIAKFDGDLANVLQIPEYQRLRSQTEPDSGCAKCYHEESCGIESMRERFNREYSTDSVELEFFEVGFDNICNLSCECCSEEFSSTWAQVNNHKTKKQSYIVNNQPVTNIPQTIKKILFLGGEPLMTNKHTRFLSQIDCPKDVDVTYNTNGTYQLNNSTVALLKKFNSVKFIVSIDGYGTDNEQVRPPSNWDDILRFLSQLKSNNFKFSIHTTLYTKNFNMLEKLSAWVVENKYDWTINLVTYPKHLDIINLSNLDKDTLLSSLDDSIPNKQYIINHLK